MPPLKRVTMQDIADACGLSRNTVSKIFNSRGAVPEATREYVLAKAQELGYHLAAGQKSPSPSPAPIAQNIALLTHSKPSLHNFGSQFITEFTDQICRFGYNLKIFEISEEAYLHQTLPAHFVLSEISGIITLELFDPDYTRMICDLGIPVMLIDTYAGATGELMQCDLVYMENYASTLAMTSHMLSSGARHVGFVGDINHCTSFRERWDGFQAAMRDAELPVDRSVCILDEDSLSYGEVDWILQKLDAMPYIPDAFVCCNDFMAIRIIWALKRRGCAVPGDVMVTGFDGTPEAEIVEPSLTTAMIPSAKIGRISADMLMNRIANPELPFRRTVIRTTPIWRESTRDL